MQFNANAGWIAIGDESVAYGTAAGTPVYQHLINCTMKPRRERVKAPALGSNAAKIGLELLKYSEGGVVIGHTNEDDDVGVIYGHLASLSGSDYTFGDTPSVDSHTLFADYNGVEYDFVGCVARSIRWDLLNNAPSTITLDYIGRYPTKYGGSRTPTVPPEGEIVLPGDLSTFTIGGTALGNLKRATITFAWPCTGIERTPLGSNVLRQPVRSGRPVITFDFLTELDSATGFDTVAQLDDLLADSSAGTIVCNNFELSGARYDGELPDLSGGLVDVNLRGEATGLVVTTS